MSIALPKMLDLREYHSVMLLHTYGQIQTIIDSGATEYPDNVTEALLKEALLKEALTIRIDNDGKIANTTIHENGSKFGSAYDDSNLD
jgi:hypothetical protein